MLRVARSARALRVASSARCHVRRRPLTPRRELRPLAQPGGAGEADGRRGGHLDPREGRELMERMFKAVEDDNERLLRRFRDRLDL